MPTLALVGAVLAVAVAAAVVEPGIARRRRRRRFRVAWGVRPERLRHLEAIAGFHRFVEGTDGDSLPDRTWADLHLDQVFDAIDHTVSSVGRQALYRRLRRTGAEARREAFEQVVTRFSTDVSARERAQLALHRLESSSGYGLWRLAVPGAVQAPWWFGVFPVLSLGVIASALTAPFWPPAVVLLIVIQPVNMMARAATGWRLAPLLGPLRQVGPLLLVARSLRAIPGLGSGTGRLAPDDVRALRGLGRIVRWVSRDPAAQGEILAMLFEYLNLVLLLDANALFFGARELSRCREPLVRLIEGVGDVDAALSVASFRAGTVGWTRPVFTAPGTALAINGMRHPLIADCVANSVRIDAGTGVILTGSNMSGKTTCVRTIGVSAVMAQALNTCLAEAYQAPVLCVGSCIGRSDDLLAGKSYYLAEVEAVLELVRASASSDPHLFLFDELFRGTNVIERLAAGEAVLAALPGGAARTTGARPAHYVVAATHDGELVGMLAGTYQPLHFEGTIGADGLRFDYRLTPGPATNRNAIALLELNGAPPGIVQAARRRAEQLDAGSRPDPQLRV